MYTRPCAPRSISGVRDDTVQLYKASFSVCWIPSAAIGLLMLAWATGPAAGNPLAVDTGTSLAQLSAQLSAQLLSVQTAAYLLVVLPITLLGYLVMMAAMIAVTRGGRPGLGAAMHAGLRRWVAGLLATILFGVCVLAPGILGGVAGGLSGMGPIALFIFIVPLGLVGCYFAGRLQLYVVAVMAEGAGPTTSLAISWRMIRGHWWRTTTGFGVLVTIAWLLPTLAGVVASGLALILGLGTNSLDIITQAVAAFAGVFTLPLMPAILIAIYHDLELRQQGGTGKRVIG